jgi:hypothetical protein
LCLYYLLLFKFGTADPLAAIWANAVFAESLESVAKRQVECFELIDALNEIGLTDRIDFREWEIAPSFFRMSATWKDEPQDEALLKALGDRGFSVCLESPPVRLIYQQPAFLAMYGGLDCWDACPRAESYAWRQVCLRGSNF